MAMASGRRPGWRGVAIGAVVVLVGVVVAVRALVPPSVPVILAGTRPLVQKVVANGRVNVPVRAQVGAQASGILARLHVDQGDTVRAGQLLAELAADEAGAGVARAAARLQQVRELDLPAARENLRQAEVALRQAERNLLRTSELGDGVSAQELEDARDERDLARSRRDAAAARVRGDSPGGSNERLAAAELAAAQARLDQTRVTALGDGIVLQRLAQPGDAVAAGTGILDLAPLGPTWLVVQPEEKNLAFLREGQLALASADAFPDSVFTARITRVAPAVDPARGTIDVDLVVDRPPTFLRPDMTVSIAVETARRDAALVVPADAVRETDGSAWVLTVRDGRATRQDVTLGLRGEGMVEITSGLQAGDAVVPAGAARVKPGDRVRAAGGGSR
ncbi:MAG: efflux RND transporter periplasmic adaptor subunit [bacterium]|nr:efflux RND transporter periplasmic adaptor subunit [bacterium]